MRLENLGNGGTGGAARCDNEIDLRPVLRSADLRDSGESGYGAPESAVLARTVTPHSVTSCGSVDNCARVRSPSRAATSGRGGTDPPRPVDGRPESGLEGLAEDAGIDIELFGRAEAGIEPVRIACGRDILKLRFDFPSNSPMNELFDCFFLSIDFSGIRGVTGATGAPFEMRGRVLELAKRPSKSAKSS